MLLNIVGERHRMRILKTKVGGKADKVTDCYFHTSNGVLIPEGFDFGRDLLELALDVGVVARSGSWYSWGDDRLGAGANAVVKLLAGDDSMRTQIEQQVRDKFAADDAA